MKFHRKQSSKMTAAHHGYSSGATIKKGLEFAEKKLEMLSAPHTESTTGEEEGDLLELICLT